MPSTRKATDIHPKVKASTAAAALTTLATTLLVAKAHVDDTTAAAVVGSVITLAAFVGGYLKRS